MQGARDIRWLEGLDRALEEARRLGRAVVAKPLGQGSGPMEDW